MRSRPVTTPGLFVLVLGIVMIGLYALFLVVVLA